MTWKETKSVSHSQEKKKKRNKKDPTFGIYQVKTLKELKKFCLENEMVV